MPVGELEELTDAYDILNGFIDECIENDFIPDVR